MRRLVLVALLCAGLLAPPAASAQTPEASAPAAPEITAEGAVLWDPLDQRVLFDRDARLSRPMASTTKIMTALLALEAGAPAEEVVVSERAAAIGRTPGGATLGLEEGQRLPLSSLLAGMILRSGNDTAVAVAEHVAGSEEAFVEKMNARAAELGLDDTRFVNASGLTDDPEHRASPLDLAMLAHEAMSDPEFARLAGAPELEVPGIGLIASRNDLLTSFEGATGVKTGYTALAGLCLVASATRDGRTYYAVVLNSQDSFGDAAALLEHGFADFRVVSLPSQAAARFSWADATVRAVPAEPLAATAAADAPAAWRAVLAPTLPRPAPAGAPAGVAELLVDGEVVARTPLHLAEAVDAPDASRSSATRVGMAVQDTLRSFARLRPIEFAEADAA